MVGWAGKYGFAAWPTAKIVETVLEYQTPSLPPPVKHFICVISMSTMKFYFKQGKV
jgi:hypothetical protein